MNRRSKLSLVPLLALLFAGLGGVRAEAGCNVVSTLGPLLTFSPFVTVKRVLSAATFCVSTANSNAFCGPASMGSVKTTLTVVGSVMSVGYCNWSCGCGTVTASTDGLPVELMDFDVEAADGSSAEEQASGRGRAGG